MICPILKLGSLINRTVSSMHSDCRGEKCAWWDEYGARCAILTIGLCDEEYKLEALQRQADADTTVPSNTEEADADRLDATDGEHSGGETH